MAFKVDIIATAAWYSQKRIANFLQSLLVLGCHITPVIGSFRASSLELTRPYFEKGLKIIVRIIVNTALVQSAVTAALVVI